MNSSKMCIWAGMEPLGTCRLQLKIRLVKSSFCKAQVILHMNTARNDLFPAILPASIPIILHWCKVLSNRYAKGPGLESLSKHPKVPFCSYDAISPGLLLKACLFLQLPRNGLCTCGDFFYLIRKEV